MRCGIGAGGGLCRCPWPGSAARRCGMIGAQLRLATAAFPIRRFRRKPVAPAPAGVHRKRPDAGAGRDGG